MRIERVSRRLTEGGAVGNRMAARGSMAGLRDNGESCYRDEGRARCFEERLGSLIGFRIGFIDEI